MRSARGFSPDSQNSLSREIFSKFDELLSSVRRQAEVKERMESAKSPISFDYLRSSDPSKLKIFTYLSIEKIKELCSKIANPGKIFKDKVDSEVEGFRLKMEQLTHQNSLLKIANRESSERLQVASGVMTDLRNLFIERREFPNRWIISLAKTRKNRRWTHRVRESQQGSAKTPIRGKLRSRKTWKVDCRSSEKY